MDSFFSLFKSYKYDEEKLAEQNRKKKENPNDNEEDEYDDLEVIQEDYDVGLFIKDDLIPYAVEYYLGINPEEGLQEEIENEEEEEEEETKEKSRKKVYTYNIR